MSWPAEQIHAVENVTFHPERRGYHPQDVERLRKRALVHMRRGVSLPDLDAVALRRTGLRGPHGVSRQQVDGLLTILTVWAAEQRIAAGAARATARRDRWEPLPPRWSPRQIALVSDKTFGRGRRGTAYAESSVDAYLGSVVAAMTENRPLPDPTRARFPRAGRRRGYDCKSVDDFLDALTMMVPED